MKKRLLLSLIIILSSLSLYAQKETPRFKGIEIGGRTSDFHLKLQIVGFVHDYEYSRLCKDKIFKGKFGTFEDPCHVWLKEDDGNVLTLIVMSSEIDTWEDLLGEYIKMVELLKLKYGEPTKNKAEFIYPFKLGDGLEMKALKANKCIYKCFWSDINGISIHIQISETTVNMFYINNEASAKAARENAKKAYDDI